MTIATMLQGNTREILSCAGSDTMRFANELLAREKIGALPVLEDGKVVGILSERDVIYRLASDGAAMLDMPVSEVMTSPVITVTLDTPVLSALSVMSKRGFRHLPVVDNDALKGFVSIRDLVQFRINKIEAEANAMRDYIAHGYG